MGLLDDLQAQASKIIDSAGDKISDQISGQQEPLPTTVVAPSVATTVKKSMDSSLVIYIAGAGVALLAAMVILKKFKAA